MVNSPVKIMSKSSCATQNTFTVRELRDDELQEVSGGSNEVASIVATLKERWG
jgi:bacteriocin-like protein